MVLRQRLKSVLWVTLPAHTQFTGENTAEKGRSWKNNVLKARENIFNHWYLHINYSLSVF